MKPDEAKIQEWITQILATTGIPANLGDRLDAYRLGVNTGVRTLAAAFDLEGAPTTAKAEDNGEHTVDEPIPVAEEL